MTAMPTMNAMNAMPAMNDMPAANAAAAVINPLVNTPQQHAYVMQGAQTLFLCHLTMFHMEEHEYQLVLRARLPEYAMRHYVEDRQNHPDEPYFLGNIATDLLTILDIQNGSRPSFLASIWRGIPYQKTYTKWPWDNQEPLIANVPLIIERIVHYRHFDFDMNYPKSLTYVLFGSGSEAHMCHFETKEPDFDQVLSLRKVPDWLPPAQLEAGVQINIPALPGDKCFCKNPLTEPVYDVQYQGQTQQTYPIEVGLCSWFCTKITNATDPCQEG